ncbi:MAG: hypothetical protein H7145_08820 [Akkermansiaceae bacterium]|nr:hypothetical protein [Armatimonadota bacterium]
MPTYGYRCTACETTFERLQKITDPPITECVDCGAPVKKILYPVGISFKGSGFYVNDYAPSGGSSKKSGDAEAAPATASTETKSESTPAASTTPTPTPAAKTDGAGS